ncbi:hypothetical protein ElyMa_005040000 [Elysia marginata]|uniref:PiggyBac transposable element-derived protein domain-containing protein n=1 Tax=Elysia marginata TaxID=1093978 RepID=A0AAV4JA92_9GAST|nr:hypothetical protein ElyMa_005040000 [Elysia marginata]
MFNANYERIRSDYAPRKMIPRMLARFDTLISWCRMKFKAKKSHCLSTRKGKSDIHSTVAEQQRTSEKPRQMVRLFGERYQKRNRNSSAP